MKRADCAAAWAREIFGDTEVGDARLSRRLLKVVTAVAERPAGTVTRVCRNNAEQQGAYDLLSSPRLSVAAMQRSMEFSSAERAAQEEYCIVPVDGTSLTFIDHQRIKGFGPIGPIKNNVRGIKFINAYALQANGTPIGMLNQQSWTRPEHRTTTNKFRPPEETEMQYWINAVRAASSVLDECGATAWFQLDREGDCQALLSELNASGHFFTVRSKVKDRLIFEGNSRTRLHHRINRGRIVGERIVRVRECKKRKSRLVVATVRVTSATLDIRHRHGWPAETIPLNVVDIRESGTTPRGEEPIHWTLLTNFPVDSLEQVEKVIRGYELRWRIEDLHRTWKSGACNVQDCQLRSVQSVMKWATIMVAAAARIERLKHLARNEGDTPAADVFSKWELLAAITLRKKYKKRTDPDPLPSATVAEVVLWIAELGGFAGRYSGKPPGSTVIARSMDDIDILAAGLEQLAAEGKLR